MRRRDAIISGCPRVRAISNQCSPSRRNSIVPGAATARIQHDALALLALCTSGNWRADHWARNDGRSAPLKVMVRCQSQLHETRCFNVRKWLYC